MKNVYNRLWLTLAMLCCVVHADGQNTTLPSNSFNQPNAAELCGTDFFHNQKMETDIQYRLSHLETMKSMRKVSSQKQALINGIYQVPVVVHVMHKGETVGTATNISDEDVKRGVEYLNNYWRKVSASLGDGLGVDMKIEFALAVQDENGNCTNGINRVDMSGVPAYVNNGVNRNNTDGLPDYDASGGINSLKEYGIWDPTKYYNVWIVDEIDNKNCFTGGSYTSGYAYFASAHGRAYDGSVVLICSYLNENSSTWAHEMGHAFNLPHTFSGDDPDNDICGDDNIFDTPSHIRSSGLDIGNDCDNTDSNSCDPAFNEVINPDNGFRRNTGSHQDHIYNYMDYSSCGNEFTGGQRAVVTNALTVTRASFLSSPGLTPPETATVFFTASNTTVCTGGTVTFNDKSSCTPNTYTNTGYDHVTFLWSIDNGVDTPYTSTEQNPTITFTNSGTFDVTLEVTNPAGTTSLVKSDHITVGSGAKAGCSVTTIPGNINKDFRTGVTNISFNSLENTTGTAIPANPVIQDFTCSNNTTINLGSSYDLDVSYKSRGDGAQFLEVWIDWDNSGTFEASNTNGDNERVLTDNVESDNSGTHLASASVTAPANTTIGALLRMRVISNYNSAPNVCGDAQAQRADDYGVFVKAACISLPEAIITNNSSSTILTCTEPEISLTASGGVSFLWNNNLGIEPTVTVTEAGTYEVTVTDVNGCTDTESIVITEDKPLPSVSITNNTGVTVLTCDLTTINVIAAGGVSYRWDNGLGTNPEIDITVAGSYTVTATAANGCTNTATIVVTNEAAVPSCDIESFNTGANYGCGVTRVTLNTIDNSTSTAVPNDAMNNFICSDNTVLSALYPHDLDVVYRSRGDGSQFLEVWIDWNNNGIFETLNSNGNNENVLLDNIEPSTSETASTIVVPPGTAVQNTLLRMRVISNFRSAPVVCGRELVQRADDYGVIVCAPPTSSITNNTGSTVLNCDVTSISVTATGGDSYIWDNGLGTNANATLTAAGTYTVTVLSADGCRADESIVITQDSIDGKLSLLGNSMSISNGSSTPSLSNDTDFGDVLINTNSSRTFTIENDGISELVISDITIGGVDAGLFSIGDIDLSSPLRIVGGSNASFSIGVLPTTIGVKEASITIDNNDCAQNTFVFDIQADGKTTLDIKENNKSLVRIYPNPVQEVLRVSLENSEVIKAYSIYDLSGKTILYHGKVINDNIPVSNLANGIYFLKIKTETSELMTKFIKE
ncbi:GEVED domain-containing protein [Algibacter mikhailovii]|nr:GEVED domain-containing protein [Algibacter mikhailovii]